MKQQHINVFRTAWILIIVFYSPLLWAQPYSGGSNSGAAAANTVAANCTANRFFGGDFDGAGMASTSLQNCTPIRFFGDTTDGSAAATTALNNCTTERFFGDTTDGAGNAATSNFNCTPLRFFGDGSDGASATATNLLNCTVERFRGDSSDGFATAKFVLIRKFLGNDTTVVIVCSNETFSLLTLYNAPGLSYSWDAPTPAAAGIGIYQLIATNQSGCRDTAVATLEQNIAKWTGSVSSNWHTAANWDKGKIPDEQTHVIIPGGTANICQVADENAKAASVQAKSSSSFSIINNRLLLITANCSTLPTGQ